MTDLKLKDHAARERIRRDLAVSMIVEAAAGTGKTTLMIERILNLIIKKEVSLTSVAAITFTEKAAGELKQRLREKLEERIHADPDGQLAQRFRDSLTELDLMPVNTIHGFCLDLIRQLPVEAGIDPDVRILDDAAETELKDEFWTEWLTKRLSAECEPLQPFLDWDLGLLSSHRELSLRAIFDTLVLNIDTVDELKVESEKSLTPDYRLDDIANEFARGEIFVRECSDPGDKLLAKIGTAREWMESQLRGTIDETVSWLIDFREIKPGNSGTQKAWGSKETIAEVRAWLREFSALVLDVRADYFSSYADKLVQWLKTAAREFTQLKHKSGRVGFQDLLVIARDLLRDSKAARAIFKNRFDFLLIDEFQDTDPLQTEIIFFLSEQPGKHAPRWEEVTVKPGKLFIVGDPKQSIYRFRRADLELYGKVKRKLQADGRAETINVSFRGLKPIIDEVNAIFAPCMTMPENADSRYEPDYVRMEPVRPAREEPAVELLTRIEGGDMQRSTAFPEAAAIVEHIRKLVESGRQIEVKGELRAVGYGDIAVLLRKWTRAGELERELRAREIPFEMSSGRFFGQRAEVIALRTMLAALDNSFDELNIVGALRSSLLGCSDDELLLHRLHGGSFNYMTDAAATGHLRHCMNLLRDLHAKKQTHTVSELIFEILDATHAAELLALKPQGETRVDNLRRLIDFVRGIEADATLHTIVRRLDDDSFIQSAGEAAGGDASADCVQVLSFHKAKGLEFPVVMIYGIGHRRQSTHTLLYDRDRARMEFSKGDLQTAGFAAAKEEEKLREDYEEMRLLYVAMTRARDLLVLPVAWERADAKKPMSVPSILRARYPIGSKNSAAETAARIIDVGEFDLDRLPTERLLFDFEQPFTDLEVTEARERLNRWNKLHASAVAKLYRALHFGAASRQPETAEPYERAEEAEPLENGRSLGNFVHSALERINLPAGANLAEVLASLRQRCALTHQEFAEAESMLRRLLESDFMRERVGKAEQLYRELPYAVMLNGVLYRGNMDLVFFEDEKPVIVDYKTNRNFEPAYLTEKYFFQAEIYARALEVILGDRIKEVILYPLRSGKPIPLSRAHLGLTA